MVQGAEEIGRENTGADTRTVYIPRWEIKIFYPYSIQGTVQIRYPSNFALLEGVALSSKLPGTGPHSL